MVIIDPTEADSDTRLPAIPNAITWAGLEALTGADLLLSALDAPASTETLIRKHITAGALLVQRKSGADWCTAWATGSTPRWPGCTRQRRARGAARAALYRPADV